MKPLDWLLLAGLALAVFTAVRSLRRGRGRCGGCSGDCLSCVKNGGRKNDRRPR